MTVGADGVRCLFQMKAKFASSLFYSKPFPDSLVPNSKTFQF
jgi:hypothetical protein